MLHPPLGGRFIEPTRRRLHANLEKRVLQTLRRRWSLLRVVKHVVRHDLDGVGAGVWNELLQRRGRELREAEVHFGGQLHALWPNVAARRAEHRTHLVNFVGLAGSGEQGAQGEHFCHDAPHRPDVDGGVVVRGSEQHLRSTVPARGHVVCEGGPRADFAREPKVCHLADVAADQEVFGLDVPVEEAVFVHVGEALEYLVHEVADFVLRHGPLEVLGVLVQIAFHVFEHKEELVVFTNDLFQFDDVRVVELLQRLHLSQLHALLPRVKLLLHALDGGDLARLPVDGAQDGPIRTITKLFGHLVPIHVAHAKSAVEPWARGRSPFASMGRSD